MGKEVIAISLVAVGGIKVILPLLPVTAFVKEKPVPDKIRFVELDTVTVFVKETLPVV